MFKHIALSHRVTAVNSNLKLPNKSINLEKNRHDIIHSLINKAVKTQLAWAVIAKDIHLLLAHHKYFTRLSPSNCITKETWHFQTLKADPLIKDFLNFRRWDLNTFHKCTSKFGKTNCFREHFNLSIFTKICSHLHYALVYTNLF